MKTTAKQDKALLLKTAQAVYDQLENRTEGTSLQLRRPRKVYAEDTGGWRVHLGSLGKGQPRLEIWLDHFTGYDERKFTFCFYWDNPKKMRRLADRASKQLPVRQRFTEKDVKKGDDFFFLRKRLRRDDFGAAIFEEYREKWAFFGIYELTPPSAGTEVNPDICARGAAFFETVTRAQPGATPADTEEHEVYPRVENRNKVNWHLRRERSIYLATQRKMLDDYECEVCHNRFEDLYGKLGECFAEAHHRVPLATLKKKVVTRVEDLATVCANCHRMLHRMEGKFNDVEKLKAIFRKREQKKNQ